jgi:hypothetical protein
MGAAVSGKDACAISLHGAMNGWLRALCALALLAGCSSGGPKKEGPGGSGPLSGFDGGGSGPIPGVDGGGGGPIPGVDGGGGGFTAYCGRSDSTECACGADPNSAYTAGAHCGPGDVGSPARCCASAAWPGRTPGNGFDLECVCSQIFCVESSLGDFCSCGFATAQQGDHTVSSCSGVTCCRTRGTLAPICSCWTSNVPCSAGDEPVPSCGTSDVLCDAQTVAACN